VLSGIVGQRFNIRVIDAIIDKIKERECLEQILDHRPQAVIFTTGTATLRSDLSLAERIKKARKETKIIASAGILKFIGRELLQKCPSLDALLLDYTAPEILGYLSDGSPAPLPGLIFRRGDQLLESEEPLPRDFEIPRPRHELFNFKKYRIPIARRSPFTVVITSLGCPYRCGFCTAGAYGYRVRHIDNVIEELRYLQSLGVREILFQDPTLTINTPRIVELCRKIVQSSLDFTWSANADVRSLNEEKVQWLKRAGCHTVSIGIESGDNGMLKKYSKLITVEQIEGAVDLLAKHKIRVLGYFILGLPGETRESALRTIKLAPRLKIDIASFAIATPDLGTALRREAIEKGWIRPDLDSFDSTEFPIIAAGEMTAEEIWQLRKKAVRKFYLRPGYILQRLGRVRSWRDLSILASNALSLLSR
jgi:radical SAM superfamily enzyme YgiQ (UPF0313 family)